MQEVVDRREESVNDSSNVEELFIPICGSHSIGELINHAYWLGNSPVREKVTEIAVPDNLSKLGGVRCKVLGCTNEAISWLKVTDWFVEKINNYSRFHGFVPKVNRILEKDDSYIRQVTTYLGLKTFLNHNETLHFLKNEKNNLARKVSEDLDLNLNEMNFRIKRLKYMKFDGSSLVFQPKKNVEVVKFELPVSKGEIVSDIQNVGVNTPVDDFNRMIVSSSSAIVCSCGGRYIPHNRDKHFKSEKHIMWQAKSETGEHNVNIGRQKVDILASDILIGDKNMVDENPEVTEAPTKDDKTLLRERRISIYGVRRILKGVGFSEEVLADNVYKLTSGKTVVTLFLKENKVEIDGKTFTS